MRRPMAWAGAYAVLASVVAMVFAAAILFGPYRAMQRSDYMTYQVAARIVLDGNGDCLYTVACQEAAQHELIGDEPSFANGALPFNSPPWLAALVVPLGVLPLSAGFAVFTLVGVLVLVWGVWRALTHPEVRGRGPGIVAVVLVLTAWPTAMAVIRGQSTLLVVGLLGLSVGLPRYRSGLAMGLALLKPTLPPVWAAWQLLGSHWRAVGTMAATGLALVAVSAVVVSPQAVADYPSHLLGVAGGDTPGVHPAEMVNWRGAAARLGTGGWLVVAGSLGTLALVLFVWFRSSSRHLGAAAAFLATPLILPHANQHEFVLATLGVLLTVIAVPELRRALSTLAIALHALLWTGVALGAPEAAWLLFGAQLGWLLIVAWVSRRPVGQGSVPLPTATAP